MVTWCLRRRKLRMRSYTKRSSFWRTRSPLPYRKYVAQPRSLRFAYGQGVGSTQAAATRSLDRWPGRDILVARMQWNESFQYLLGSSKEES